MSKIVIEIQKYERTPIGLVFPDGSVGEVIPKSVALTENDALLAKQHDLSGKRARREIPDSQYQIEYMKTFLDFSPETEDKFKALKTQELDQFFDKLIEAKKTLNEEAKKN